MTIYDSSCAIVYEAPITASAVIKRVLMGDYYIELTFDAVERVDVSRGCYILFNGHKFEIMSNVLPEDANNGGLRYTLRFEAQQSQMKRCKVFWRDSANLEVSFSNTTSLDHFGELIITNVNAFLGTDTWSLGSVPADLKKTLKTVSFNGDSCLDAVANIAETFGVEWWTEEDGENVSLCFGKLEHGTEVEFRKGDIVSSIPSKKGDSANYGTRFYVFGSTKNLPADYASTDEGGIVNHIVEKRLHLPDGRRYIDAWDNLAKEDIVEQVVFFDDIYPTNVDTVTSVTKESGTPIEGRFDFIYTVYCANTPFTPDYIIEGEQIQATFTSGDLVGQTFDVEVNTTSFDKRFRIVPNVLDAENGILLPNDSSNPKEGDTFILTGIQLPKERIEEAEQSLLEAGIEYAKKNSSDTEVYDCPTNAVYCHKNNCNYDLGQKVVLVGDKFGSGRSSRIQGYEKKLYNQYQATYTVGDNSPYSRLASVEKAIQKSSYADRVGLEANIIRSKSDSTIPSDFNVYSALATLEYFLHKNRGGIVKGHTDFAKGISIYGKELKYYPEKDALSLPFNVIIERGFAWNSRLENFTDEEIFTITKAVNVDGKTIKKDPETGALYAVSSGTGGGFDETQLADYLAKNKYITESALQSYAKTTDLDKYLLRSGGKITGELQITKGDNGISGGYLYFGDRGYVYITENTEDHLSIYADRGIDLSTGDNYSVKINGSAVVTEEYVNSALTDYLSLSGGTIDGNLWVKDTIYTKVLSVDSPQPEAFLAMKSGKASAASYLVYASGTEWFITDEGWHNNYAILHANNVSQFALSASGGTVNGSVKINGSNSAWAFTVEDTNSYYCSAHADGYGFFIGSNSKNAGKYIIRAFAGDKYGRVDGGGVQVFEVLDNGNVNIAGNVTASKFVGALEGSASSLSGSGFGYPGYDANTASATTIVRYTYGNNAPQYGALLDVSIDQYGFQLNTGSNTDGPLYYRRHAHPNEGGFGAWQQLARVTESSLTPTGGTLTVNGNILSTGRIAWNSSRVLKNIIDERYLTLDEMLQMKPYTYTWKDGRDNLIHVGAVADDIKKILPETVLTDSKDIHSMDYAQTAYVMCASLTRELAKAKAEIRELKGVA